MVSISCRYLLIGLASLGVAAVLFAGSALSPALAATPLLDPTFAGPPLSLGDEVRALARQPDGRLLIGGRFTTTEPVIRRHLARLDSYGALDPDFDVDLGATGSVYALAAAPDGRLVVAGAFTAVNGTPRRFLARLLPDGTLDTSFNVSLNGQVTALALQPDGRLLIGGNFSTVDGVARNGLARLSDDGSLDTSFTSPFAIIGPIFSLALQPDGRLLVGGMTFYPPDFQPRHGLVRLNADGSLESDFRPNLDAAAQVHAIALQPDGRIVLGGRFSTVGGVARGNLARLQADGSLDAAFGLGEAPDEAVYALALQADGAVLVGGAFQTIDSVERPFLARLEATGQLDATFAPGQGPNNTVFVVAVQPTEQFLVAGSFTAVDREARRGIARLWSAIATPTSTPTVPPTATTSAPSPAATATAASSPIGLPTPTPIPQATPLASPTATATPVSATPAATAAAPTASPSPTTAPASDAPDLVFPYGGRRVSGDPPVSLEFPHDPARPVLAVDIRPGSAPALPLPAGFRRVGPAFQVTALDVGQGVQVTAFTVPLTLTYRVGPAALAASGGRLALAFVALGRWAAVPCQVDPSTGTLACTVTQLAPFVPVLAPPPVEPLDHPAPHGWFFRQANGFSGAGEGGYTVVDDTAAQFWTAFQRLGGVARVGYPVSGRFWHGGFLTQAFQKLALQWRPELGQAVPVNVFDDLNQRGVDTWLDVARQVPPASETAPDSGLAWDAVVARHLAFLDPYPALRDYYLADPAWLEMAGLPLAVADYGPFVAVRLQRVTLQHWRVDMPWAAAGAIVAGNAGDLAKEVGLWPLEAVIPETPPPASATTVSGDERP